MGEVHGEGGRKGVLLLGGRRRSCCRGFGPWNLLAGYSTTAGSGIPLWTRRVNAVLKGPRHFPNGWLLVMEYHVTFRDAALASVLAVKQNTDLSIPNLDALPPLFSSLHL